MTAKPQQIDICLGGARRVAALRLSLGVTERVSIVPRAD